MGENSVKYQPKVSIIIPVYNGSNFLAEAIDSALAQTYRNCEILVINDGSSDNGASEKIAQSYGNKIKYYAKANGGVSSALNFAFQKMTGEWFSWLSHDDLYYPQKIEKQVAFINNLLKQNANLNLNKITVRCATESINKIGKVIKTPSYKSVPIHEKAIDVILNNISNYRLSGCSFLLPAACVQEVGGFREDIRTVSDVEYWYRLLFNGYGFYCLKNDILVKNRSHGKQVGKTKVELFNREMNDLFIWIADEMNKKQEYATVKNNEKMYFALTKRRCKTAAHYVYQTYLKGKANAFRTVIQYPLYKGAFVCLGVSRNALRYVYRKINVK